MMSRLDVPTLILVPNLTLQEQWRDKIEKLFIEEHEDIYDLVSTDVHTIKKINILTYQSLAGTEDDTDEIKDTILTLWYESEKKEFQSRNEFSEFITKLREVNTEEYEELYAKYRKKLKLTG